jgi:Fe-S-cluster-containing dehydrogenase component
LEITKGGEQFMENNKTGKTRREFLKIAGAGGIGAASLYFIGCEGGGTVTETVTVAGGLPAAAAKYIVYDSHKCATCRSCMMACSLVNEGKVNVSLSRTQRAYDVFGKFPDDVEENICRQCVDPNCVTACPSGAFHVDASNGNVRTVDEAKCDAYQKGPDGPCQLCIDACPYPPQKVTWHHEKKVAMVCDLCANAPFLTEPGTQACVEVCPMRCIAVVTEVPDQRDKLGYDVNLRTANWLESIVTPDRYEPDARMKQRQWA